MQDTNGLNRTVTAQDSWITRHARFRCPYCKQVNEDSTTGLSASFYASCKNARCPSDGELILVELPQELAV